MGQPNAEALQFEPLRNPGFGGVPSNIVSKDVQNAIEETKQSAFSNDRFILLSEYGGNANVGRNLEIFPGQASNVSPIFFTAPTRLRSTTIQTTAAQATATIGIFNLDVSSIIPVYSVVIVSMKRVEYIGAPDLALFPANTLLSVRVIAGNINTPTMQLTFSAST